MSDGKANEPLLPQDHNDDSTTADDAWTYTARAAGELAALAVLTIMIDTDAGHVRVGRGKELTDLLRSDYLQLDELTADGLAHTIRGHGR